MQWQGTRISGDTEPTARPVWLGRTRFGGDRRESIWGGISIANRVHRRAIAVATIRPAASVDFGWDPANCRRDRPQLPARRDD